MRVALVGSRTWLSKHKRPLLALGVVAVLGVVFSLGWYAGSHATDRAAYAALWEAIVHLPDPERCALCGEGDSYHAPCLVNLSTGQLGELRVYAYAPTEEGKLDPREAQYSGTINLLPCAGLTAIRDAGLHTCQVSLPKERDLMDPALFCRECRRLLAGAGLEGYAIVDLYDLGHIRAYSIRSGSIRDYRISIHSRGGGETELCVTGLLN